MGRFAELGQEGVLALLADSTNAERPGYTPSERKISASFDILFNQARDKRIIIATFASNISRVQQIINCAVNMGEGGLVWPEYAQCNGHCIGVGIFGCAGGRTH